METRPRRACVPYSKLKVVQQTIECVIFFGWVVHWALAFYVLSKLEFSMNYRLFAYIITIYEKMFREVAASCFEGFLVNGVMLTKVNIPRTFL